MTCSIEPSKERNGSTNSVKAIKKYKKTIQVEFSNNCKDILSLLEQAPIPEVKTGESSAFFYKVKEDYYGYSAEIDAGAGDVKGLSGKEVDSNSRKLHSPCTIQGTVHLVPFEVQFLLLPSLHTSDVE